MISVIIPIYNIGQYLERCLHSLITQNNPDFEVIMVNDGSTDNSENICRAFVDIDKRFKYYYKENGGVSSARNLGLRVSKGDWILFVDGDDYVDEDYLTILNNNSDAIEKSFHIIDENDSDLVKNNEIEQEISGQSELQKYYAAYIQCNSATLCNKLIRREIIGDTKFDENIKIGEDFIFFLNIICRINKYTLSSKGVYYYIRRSSSASKTIDSNITERIDILFRNCNTVRHVTKQNGIYPLGVSIIYNCYLENLLRYKKYLSISDWYKISLIWLRYIVSPKEIMTKMENRKIKYMPLRYIWKLFKAN